MVCALRGINHGPGWMALQDAGTLRDDAMSYKARTVQTGPVIAYAEIVCNWCQGTSKIEHREGQVRPIYTNCPHCLEKISILDEDWVNTQRRPDNAVSRMQEW